jgi:hypothetical protein
MPPIRKVARMTSSNLQLHGCRAQRENFSARRYSVAGQVDENVNTGSPDLARDLETKRSVRGRRNMHDEFICCIEVIGTTAAADLIESKLRDVNHAFVASRYNAIALRAVIARAAAVADNVELCLVVQAKIRMQRAHRGC